MIYLIDDKKKRQEDFGWTEDRLKLYKNIQAIYSLKDLRARNSDIFQRGNLVIYHESFLDNTPIKGESVIKRGKLEEYAKENPDFYLSIFSGSKSSRFLEKNVAHLPVSIVYQNLDVLSDKVSEGDINLKYLLFGKNPEIEEELSSKLGFANKEIDLETAKIPISKNLFFRPARGYIQNAIEDAEVEILYNDVSDEKLSQKITDCLTNMEFDNIFIPICFGSVLSDFNGLRLATHIRCSKTPNQIKNIFIYSFVGIEYLFNHEYFNIIRTKCVQVIDHKKKAIQDAAKISSDRLTIEEVPKEIAKLKLDPPKNYEDSHSITNEWAIYKWSKTIGAPQNEELEKVFNTVRSNLFFKFLKTANSISDINVIAKEQLIIAKNDDPRILLIDDESNKGWYEIFAYLLGDLNGFYIDYIGDEFKSMGREEIINQSIHKIDNDDIDVVILDFRLNIEDFSQGNTQDVTSIQLLKKIKELNPGIQVIVFSATNKVWNLQALQKYGADGFIIKDVRDSMNQTIQNLIKNLNSCLKKAMWLKPFWIRTKSSIEYLETQRKNHVLDKDFVGAIRTYLELGFDSLVGEKSKFPYDTTFLYYFLILEASSKQLIDEDNPIKNNGKYKFQFRSNYNYLKYFNENTNERTADKLKVQGSRIPYNQKFLNLIDSANIKDVDPFELVRLRNSFNHPDLVKNRRIAVIKKEDAKQIFEVCVKLIKNL